MIPHTLRGCVCFVSETKDFRLSTLEVHMPEKVQRYQRLSHLRAPSTDVIWATDKASPWENY